MANNDSNETRLIPTYIDGDFTTSLNKFIDLLKEDETFKDFNYHGSNIAMITELMAYLADFTNFYANLVAKNVYQDTADVYETVHRLVKQKGYIPLGYLSSEAEVTMTINDLAPTGQIVVEGWHTVNTQANDADGNTIYYTLTDRQEIDIYGNEDVTVDANDNVTFTMQMRQGTIDELYFTGQDLIDNQIILPFRNYDSGNYPFDVPSVQVVVNDQEWIRVHDFYDHISGLIPDERDVYTFYYDKYKRYVVSFSSSFETPNPSDVIRIRLLRSTGTDGIIGANTISVTDDLDDFNIVFTDSNNNDTTITSSNISVFTNLEASVGGANPETIDELKVNADANMHTQFRNVTGRDYKYHMEMRSDIRKATAWGENEVDPGNTIEYNKVYVSAFPRYGNTSTWIQGVFNTDYITWMDTDVPTLSASIEIPTDYLTAFENDLIRYLEPRKMISVYEFPVIPQAVFFRFDIGIRVTRSYKYTDVLNDVKNKLVYFFNSINREYAEEINFMDIHNFIYDLSNVSETDDFLFIKGLENLVIRDISIYTMVPAPSGVTPTDCGVEISAGYWDYSMCSLDTYLSGAAYDSYMSDAKLMMGTLTYEVSAWTGFYGAFEPNSTHNYPQYTQDAKQNYIDNKLRPIQLGYNQFPMLSLDMCRFSNESA